MNESTDTTAADRRTRNGTIIFVAIIALVGALVGAFMLGRTTAPEDRYMHEIANITVAQCLSEPTTSDFCRRVLEVQP